MEQSYQADFFSVIPKLSSAVEIHAFDKENFLLVENRVNSKLKINLLTKELIQRIDGKSSVSELTSHLKKSNSTLDEMTIHRILENLKDFGVIQSDKIIVPKIKAEYLTLNFPLLKEAYVSKVSSLFRFLFTPKLFWTLLTVCVCLLTVMLSRGITWRQVYAEIQPDLILPMVGVFFISLLLHEIGHSAACSFFGARHGTIGFGFYLFTPVFYADVSDAWRLKPSQRVIIDLAGIFMELLFSTMLAVIGISISNSVLLLFSLLIILNTIKNLNPFMRFDAYWVLTDILNIPNLRQTANQKLLGFINRVFLRKKSSTVFGARDYFLVSYAGISFSLVVLFLFSVLYYNPNSILYFPKNIYGFFVELSGRGITQNFDWFKKSVIELLIPLSFYLLMISLLIRGRKSFLKIFNY